MLTMAVMVRLGNVDRERFESATQFEQHEGQLYIKDAAGSVVAVFAAGRWDGVFHVEPRKQAPTVSTAAPNVHVYVDGKRIRKAASDDVTSKALDALADSIGKQR